MTTTDAVEEVAAEAAEPEKRKGVLHYIGVGLSGGLLLLVAALAVLLIALPAAVGGMPLTVLTSSMEPGLPPGTLIVVKPTPVEEIRVGDVVTFQLRSGEPILVTHRVIERSVSSNGEVAFVTKGDNNDLADDPIREIQIRGTLWYSFPWLGWVNNALNGEARGWLVPLAAGGLFAYAGYLVISASVASAKKRKAASDESATAS
ncbi:signal peptidase I [Cryobacterium sp. BB736]|uniref:signal peptidase I n=1 Tax=Cryobacterium sp. BB736 TaxID=2746963 RepID=UPI00351C593F